MGAQVAVIKGFSGPERPTFKMVTHMAVGRSLGFLPHGLFHRAAFNMAADYPEREYSRESKKLL